MEKIEEDLGEFIRVGGNPTCSGGFQLQLDAVGLGQVLHLVYTIGGDAIGIHQRGPKGINARVDSGKGKEAFHGPVHLNPGIVTIGQKFAVFLGRSGLAQGKLTSGDQRGKGSAKLMGDVGGRLFFTIESPAKLSQGFFQSKGDGS